MLDVGCGNNSVQVVKSVQDNIYYTGIDVGDYNLDKISKKNIDEYILSDPENFAKEIEASGKFNYVISAHNLEHCNHWRETVRSMCIATSKDGMLFISTPSSQSINLPSRGGDFKLS